MLFDIALPEDNEDKLTDAYLKFRYKNVIFAYFVNDKKDLSRFKYKNLYHHEKLNIFYMAIVENEDHNATISLVAELFYNKKLYNDLVVVRTRDFEYNKRILSRYFHNGLFNLGIIDTRDSLKYRYIALPSRHFLILRKNKQMLFYSINDIIKNEIYLGRIQFIIEKIVNKKDIPIYIGSFARKPEEVPKKIQLIAFKKILKIKYPNKNVFYKNIISQINRTRSAKNPDVFMEGYYIAKHPYEDCREY